MQKKKFFRKYRLILLLVLFSVLLQLFSMIFLYSFTGEENIQKPYIERYEQVSIKKGDTLWTIAQRYNPQNQDIKKYISYIKEFNNMKTHHIYAGDSIIIPIYREKDL